MAKYMDVGKWARRDLFEFFRGYDNPYFNVCARLDITNLLTLLSRLTDTSVSLAYHYFALRVANEIEPFRYRLQDGKVLVHDVIHGGTTVLLPNETFTFAYFEYTRNFKQFMDAARTSVERARSGKQPFQATSSDALIHFTTLPWLAFTSFSHARNWRTEDSVPKIAFGKFEHQGERILLPISVEVHHALMDGLHVGRYLNTLGETLRNPEAHLE